MARYLDVWGRAENFRLGLSEAWPALRGPLLGSERLEDIIKAFEDHAQPYAQDFIARARTSSP